MGKYNHHGVARVQAYDIYVFNCPRCNLSFNFKGASQAQRIKLHNKVCKAEPCMACADATVSPDVSIEGYLEWSKARDERICNVYGVGGCRYPLREKKKGGK